MRGAEGVEKRDAEGAEGVGSEERVSPPHLRWDLGGAVPLPRIFFVNSPSFHSFCIIL